LGKTWPSNTVSEERRRTPQPGVSPEGDLGELGGIGELTELGDDFLAQFLQNLGTALLGFLQDPVRRGQVLDERTA
jgi:hypothetical protein